MKLRQIWHKIKNDDKQLKFSIGAISTLISVVLLSFLISFFILYIILQTLEEVTFFTSEQPYIVTYFLYIFSCLMLLSVTFIISRKVLEQYFFNFSIHMLTLNHIKSKYEIFSLAKFCTSNLRLIKTQFSHITILFTVTGVVIVAFAHDSNKINDIFKESTLSFALALPIISIHIDNILNKSTKTIEQSYQKALYKKFSKFFD
ncbi:hypothetical protein HCA33_05300 [Listeria seeligeri]|uniref:hypothetical protein n=1 Tax=Listeria TaxID=1637 RepID=UPI001624F112|nr:MULTISPECIES: hypothetical protein [Listeria]HBZ6456210.1 hypothetical protein [Listeria monocytogenes]MBC1814263.1 hypothetical protein [Listeria booriae]MBC1815595.1 hypothetical protein [Listeria seeligeri]MBC1879429.1 hypothetical protein [Listeria seeligeri]MBC6160731.1 hypothetical protein [Listeria seeligeri]